MKIKLILETCYWKRSPLLLIFMIPVWTGSVHVRFYRAKKWVTGRKGSVILDAHQKRTRERDLRKPALVIPGDRAQSHELKNPAPEDRNYDERDINTGIAICTGHHGISATKQDFFLDLRYRDGPEPVQEARLVGSVGVIIPSPGRNKKYTSLKKRKKKPEILMYFHGL
jgi:hypothetical protein